jgi:hypothetical protein
MGEGRLPLEEALRIINRGTGQLEWSSSQRVNLKVPAGPLDLTAIVADHGLVERLLFPCLKCLC